jgi:hypothetical protein
MAARAVASKSKSFHGKDITMLDLHSKLGFALALAPAVVTDTATSDAIDLQGFSSALAVIATGAIAGSGKFTTKLQHSDTTTGGDFVDVPDGDLLGSLPAELAASTVYKAGYKGSKRYIRTVTTKNSGTSIAASIVITKGHAASSPVA